MPRPSSEPSDYVEICSALQVGVLASGAEEHEEIIPLAQRSTLVVNDEYPNREMGHLQSRQNPIEFEYVFEEGCHWQLACQCASPDIVKARADQPPVAPRWSAITLLKHISEN